MRTFLLCAVILSGAVAMAQSPGPSFQNRQQTTGVVGIAGGQTARLNVLYPTAPAPILQVLCAATLVISDDQGKTLKSSDTVPLAAGRSISLDVNADADLTGTARTQIHGFSIAPNGCQLVTTMEIIDNITQKTVVVVGSMTTYPPSPATMATLSSLPVPNRP
jgi:hypothetical protein